MIFFDEGEIVNEDEAKKKKKKQAQSALNT